MESNNNIAIQINNLSKVYQKRTKNGNLEDFYALKNINLNIQKGEVIGIIGKNGSGKSTLLKILSGITKPSSGSIEINGTISSILDVGTGFHPDLSGRENVYLRGELLGMTRKEIDEVFDEIITFSEIGDFIETPVKNYSSGMFLRLAFSILVFLKCDILLLDEVIAVGDVGFREKSMNKINEMAISNKTILIVTHETQSIISLTEKFIIFKSGETSGFQKDTLIDYLKSVKLLKRNLQYKTFFNELKMEVFVNEKITSEAFIKDSIIIKINVDSKKNSKCELALRVRDQYNNVVFVISYLQNKDFRIINREKFIISTRIPSYFFNKGVFYFDIIGIDVSNTVVNFEYNNLSQLQINLGEHSSLWFKNSIGPVRPFLKWDIYDNN